MMYHKILTFCFYTILAALQFEEFQILGSLSVFRAIILPVSILGSTIFILKNRGITKSHLPIYVFLIWLMLMNIAYADILGVFNKIFLIPFVYFIFTYVKENKNKIIRYDRIFVLAPLVSFIAFLTGHAQIINFRFSGIYFDPNFACILFVMSFMSLLCFFQSVNKKTKVLYVILMGLNVYLVLLTQSRGALVAWLAALFIYVMAKIKSPTLRLGIIFGSFFAISTVLAFANTLDYWGGDNNIVMHFLARFTSEDIENGSGRNDLWAKAFEFMDKNDGYLLSAGYIKYREFTNYYSHNSYIDLMLDAGVLPALLFIFHLIRCGWKFLVRRLKTYVVAPHIDSLYFTGVIGCMIFVFLSSHTSKLFFFVLVATILSGTSLLKEVGDKK